MTISTRKRNSRARSVDALYLKVEAAEAHRSGQKGFHSMVVDGNGDRLRHAGSTRISSCTTIHQDSSFDLYNKSNKDKLGYHKTHPHQLLMLGPEYTITKFKQIESHVPHLCNHFIKRNIAMTRKTVMRRRNMMSRRIFQNSKVDITIDEVV